MDPKNQNNKPATYAAAFFDRTYDLEKQKNSKVESFYKQERERNLKKIKKRNIATT